MVQVECTNLSTNKQTAIACWVVGWLGAARRDHCDTICTQSPSANLRVFQFRARIQAAVLGPGRNDIVCHIDWCMYTDMYCLFIIIIIAIEQIT